MTSPSTGVQARGGRAGPDRRGVARAQPPALSFAAVATLGVFAASMYLALFLRSMARNPYDVWAAYMLALIFFGLSFPLLQHMLKAVEPDTWIRKAVIWGLVAKLAGAFARFYTNEYILGHADASKYYNHGSLIAAEFRSFVFGGPNYQSSLPDFTGTRFIRFVTGLVYTVTGSTHIGGYIVFAFMSFWGLYLFYRAYSIAMPAENRRRYTVLVFFLPSVVFWPSSIGKEAWMITMLGLGSYGLARLLTQQRFGYLAIVASIAGQAVVRPHVAAIFGLAAGAAIVLRRPNNDSGNVKKILGIVLMAVVAGLVLNQLQSFFDLENALDAQQVFDETTRRSSQGGTEFAGSNPTSLAQLPWAIVTVLFRPFLFEATSPAALLTGIEGTVLLGLFVVSLPRLMRLPALMISRPYIGFALIYSLVFAFAFSAISNFGILARQRTQLFPIVVVLMTVPIEAGLVGRKELASKRDARRAALRRTTLSGASGGTNGNEALASTNGLAVAAPAATEPGGDRPLPGQPERTHDRNKRPKPIRRERHRRPARSKNRSRLQRERPQRS